MTDEKTFEELVELFRQDFPERCRPCPSVETYIVPRVIRVLEGRMTLDDARVENAENASQIDESCRYGTARGEYGQPVCRNLIACELIPREDYGAE